MTVEDLPFGKGMRLHHGAHHHAAFLQFEGLVKGRPFAQQRRQVDHQRGSVPFITASFPDDDSQTVTHRQSAFYARNRIILFAESHGQRVSLVGDQLQRVHGCSVSTDAI